MRAKIPCTCRKDVCKCVFRAFHQLLARNHHFWSSWKPKIKQRRPTSNSCRTVAGALVCARENLKSSGFARGVSKKLKCGCRAQGAFSMSRRHAMHPKMVVSLGECRKNAFLHLGARAAAPHFLAAQFFDTPRTKRPFLKLISTPVNAGSGCIFKAQWEQHVN